MDWGKKVRVYFDFRNAVTRSVNVFKNFFFSLVGKFCNAKSN